MQNKITVPNLAKKLGIKPTAIYARIARGSLSSVEGDNGQKMVIINDKLQDEINKKNQTNKDPLSSPSPSAQPKPTQSIPPSPQQTNHDDLLEVTKTLKGQLKEQGELLKSMKAHYETQTAQQNDLISQLTQQVSNLSEAQKSLSEAQKNATFLQGGMQAQLGLTPTKPSEESNTQPSPQKDKNDTKEKGASNPVSDANIKEEEDNKESLKELKARQKLEIIKLAKKHEKTIKNANKKSKKKLKKKHKEEMNKLQKRHKKERKPYR